MSIIYSTGMVNYRGGEGSLRRALEDMILDVYGGVTPPTTADEAPGGTKLVRVTKASGSVVAITETSGRSTKTLYAATIGTGHGAGSTVKANITIDGVGPTTYTYTILAEDDSDAKVAVKVAQMLNDIAGLSCIATGTTAAFYLQGRIAGLDFTLADGGGTYTITPGAKVITGARSNCLVLGPPTGGILQKTSDVWSGVNLATGVASYFRFVLPWDTGILSTADIRAQGAIATSGAELNMTNTTLTIGATTTIDAASITLPKS
jgi:hypothetical protein